MLHYFKYVNGPCRRDALQASRATRPECNICHRRHQNILSDVLYW